jgi:hypothetical protein
VKSGSYFTALFVVVFGITILDGFGGSFFITGFAVGLIETNDCGSFPDFLTMGFGGCACCTGLGSGFATGLTGTLGATGFAATTGFFTAGLAMGFDDFFATGALAAFLTAGFLATAFFAGFAAFAGLDAFFATGFVAFFGAGFFLLAIKN